MMDKVTTSLNEHGIELTELMKLQSVFQENGGLDEKEFIKAFSIVLGDNGKLDKQKLTHLFMKIDANSDGSVDWDEFTNYMFLHSQTTSDVILLDTNDQFIPSENSKLFYISNGPSFSPKDTIAGILPNDKMNQYISYSHEGHIRIWNPLNLQQISYINAKSTLRHTNDWITSISYMSYSNKIAVASIEDSVLFYDILTQEKRICSKIPSSDLSHASPLCLGYYYDQDKNSELFMIGDDAGCVTIYNIIEKNWHICDGHLECHNTSTHRHLNKIRFKKHMDHVTKVAYIPDLGCLVSSSLDSTVKVMDIDRKKIKRDFKQHKKPVYSFAWCHDSKIIASCGLERFILLWSPYSIRVVAKLTGHLASIKSVIPFDDNHMLISLSDDGIVKIWDIRNYKCIQTIIDSVHHKNHVNAILFDIKNHNLITCSEIINYWSPSKLDNHNNKIKSHEYPLCEVLYNPSFHQVVSVDLEANVCIWNIENGLLISKFKVKTNDEHNVTAASLDLGGRRLITGSHQGKDLKIWNYSNGCLLHTLEKIKNEKEYLYDMSQEQDKEKDKERDKDKNNKSDIIDSSPKKPFNHLYSSNKILTTKLKEKDLILQNNNTINTTTIMNGSNITNNIENNRIIKKKAISNEVTKILCIMNSVPQVGGKLPIQNRFILSVGWDKKIYIWSDDNESRKHEYLSCFPPDEIKNENQLVTIKKYSNNDNNDDNNDDENDIDNDNNYNKKKANNISRSNGTNNSNSNKGKHIDDILSLTYCPSTLIATGGYDKKLILWNLNTGLFHGEHIFLYPVEHMIYILKLKLLFLYQNDDNFYFINPKLNIIYAKLRMDLSFLVQPHNSNNNNNNSNKINSIVKIKNQKDVSLGTFYREISVIYTDLNNEYMFMGTNNGFVLLFNIIDDNEIKKEHLLSIRTKWQAHIQLSITSLGYVELPHALENFLLTGSNDGNICLWTLCGAKIGNFGQLIPWNIYDINYKNVNETIQKQINYHLDEIQKSFEYIFYNNNTIDEFKHDLNNDTNAMEINGSIHLPTVNEVWIKKDNNGMISNLLTVISADRMKGNIEGWNGYIQFINNLNEKTSDSMISIPTIEFCNLKDKYPWEKDIRLTKMIGRIYHDNKNNNNNNNNNIVNPYKILYIVYNFLSKTWHAMDTFFSSHPLPPNNNHHLYKSNINIKTLSNAEKSLSLHYLRHNNLLSSIATNSKHINTKNKNNENSNNINISDNEIRGAELTQMIHSSTLEIKKKETVENYHINHLEKDSNLHRRNTVNTTPSLHSVNKTNRLYTQKTQKHMINNFISSEAIDNYINLSDDTLNKKKNILKINSNYNPLSSKCQTLKLPIMGNGITTIEKNENRSKDLNVLINPFKKKDNYNNRINHMDGRKVYGINQIAHTNYKEMRSQLHLQRKTKIVEESMNILNESFNYNDNIEQSSFLRRPGTQ